MFRCKLWAILLVVFVCSSTNAVRPRVKSSIGTIIGRQTEFRDVHVDEFEGIPYAKPPVGDLRFALPVPFGPVGKLSATKLPARCPQFDLDGLPVNPIPEAEDCLFLNVFRRSGTKAGDNKAVIVFFHGGAYYSGASTDLYGLPLTAVGDIVLVTPNFRVGVLGFADMGDLAPGNLGLHDQRLALQWIQDNIRAFGGNPDRVTLFGISSGATSVSAQIITPLNHEGRKLFHAGILDAGVLGPNIVADTNTSLNRMKKIAEQLNCTTEGSEMVDCLRMADDRKLVELSLDPEGYSPTLTFHPTLDGKFLPRDIALYVRDNADTFAKVKLLIGNSKNEGAIVASNTIDFGRTKFPNLKTEQEFLDWCDKLSTGYRLGVDLKNEEIRKLVSEVYYEKNPTRHSDASDFVGDGVFVCATNAFVKSYAKTNHNVYAFRFERKFNDAYPVFNSRKFGVPHGSPFAHMTGFVFRLESFLGDGFANDEDKKFSLDAMKLVADFAKFDDAPQFRGVKLPDMGKGEGVMVFDNKPHVAATLFSEDRCKRVFPHYQPSTSENAAEKPKPCAEHSEDTDVLRIFNH